MNRLIKKLSYKPVASAVNNQNWIRKSAKQKKVFGENSTKDARKDFVTLQL